ncbi:hypothetical protein ACHAWF_008012 [Thalassiosira exigua]
MAPTMNVLLERDEPSLFASSPSYERCDSSARDDGRVAPDGPFAFAFDARPSAATPAAFALEARAPPPLPRSVEPDHPALLGSLTPPEDCPAPKIYNFSPGPTNLPAPVEAEIKARCLPDPSEMRLGSMALSHRSPEFGRILQRALRNTRRAMEVPPEYDVLFMQGGGHGQFAAVPLNLCPTGSERATFVVNGTWSRRCVDEASKYCVPDVISSLEADGSCATFPSFDRLERGVHPRSAFLYVCSNETVNGVELRTLPPRLSSGVPLVVDASSDFTSKPVDWRGSNVGVLFACASKNVGHPGVTVVVVRKDLLGRANPFCPGVFSYETNLAAENVWNTVPTFNVDVVGILMGWINDHGGVREMERRSAAKADLVYDAVDGSDGFFATPVSREGGLRSRMNVPFCVADGDEALTDLFLVECWERGIVGLRTVTPFAKSKYLRASLYHGVSYEDATVLVAFMKEFAARHRAPTASELALVEEAPVVDAEESYAGQDPEPVLQAAPAVAAREEEEAPAIDPDSPPESPLPQRLAQAAALAEARARDLLPPPPPAFEQDLRALGLGWRPCDRAEELFGSLSSSPDDVAALYPNILTLPKDFKASQYARVSRDMFAPPPPSSASSSMASSFLAPMPPSPPALVACEDEALALPPASLGAGVPAQPELR